MPRRVAYMPAIIPDERPFMRVRRYKSLYGATELFLGMNFVFKAVKYNGWGMEVVDGWLGDWPVKYIGRLPYRMKGQIGLGRRGAIFGWDGLDVIFKPTEDFSCMEVAEWVAGWGLTAFIVNVEAVSVLRGKVVRYWEDWESFKPAIVEARKRILEIREAKRLEKKVLSLGGFD